MVNNIFDLQGKEFNLLLILYVTIYAAFPRAFFTTNITIKVKITHFKSLRYCPYVILIG